MRVSPPGSANSSEPEGSKYVKYVTYLTMALAGRIGDMVIELLGRTAAWATCGREWLACAAGHVTSPGRSTSTKSSAVKPPRSEDTWTTGRAALACRELSDWGQPTDSSRLERGDTGRICQCGLPGASSTNWTVPG